MGKLLIKHTGENGELYTRTLENVIDAGVANDFLAIRYADGTVTFTKSEPINEFQFEPDPPTDEADSGEGQNDTPSQ